MDNREILPARKGHVAEVSFFAFMVAGFGALLAYVIYDFIALGGDESRRLLVVIVVLFPLVVISAFRPGRYVVVDIERRIISRPTWSKRISPTMIPVEKVQSYMRIRSVSDKKAIVGLIIHTRDGEKIRYSEKSTPGCVSRIVSLLERSQAKEEIPERQLVG